MIAAIIAVLPWLSQADESSAPSAQVLASEYPSLQAALDANPGRVVFVPAGEYRISEPLHIRADGSGLRGPGTIVQTDSDADIIQAREVAQVVIEGLTLTRPQEDSECIAHGIYAEGCRELRIESVRVHDNRSPRAAIRLERCQNAVVANCELVNYKRISVDDRTHDPNYGYAFRCIDGMGIWVEHSRDVRIAGNRIVEKVFIPTPEFVQQHNLGQVIKRNERLGRLAPNTIEREARVTNWHQGSAILVTGPRDTRGITVANNLIDNAGQGVDIHADEVEVTGNLVNCASIGIKAMHGSSDVLIIGNLLTRVDLWGILLSPGSSATPDNPQRNLCVEANVIWDIGYGPEYWHWSKAAGENNPIAIKLESGPFAETPVMTNVIVRNNVVANQDALAPRYRWALWIDQNPCPQDVQVSGNVFDPGSAGVTSVETASDKAN